MAAPAREIAEQREYYYRAQEEDKGKKYLYVLSNTHFAEHTTYKIGVHQGSQESLLKAHENELMYPTIYLWLPTSNAEKIREQILAKNKNTNLPSGWITLLLSALIGDILEERKKHVVKKK